MARCWLIPPFLIVAAFPAAAPAQESGVSAVIVHPRTTDAPPCDSPLCAALMTHDVWKRNVIPRFNADTLNADAVALDRSRRGELDQRFTETPPLEIRIGKSSCFGTAQVASVFTGLGDTPYLRVLKCGFEGPSATDDINKTSTPCSVIPASSRDPWTRKRGCRWMDPGSSPG